MLRGVFRRLPPVLGGALLVAVLPFAAALPIQETILDNGLRILVKEDHRAPVVVSQVWYKVGSSYEHLGITGSSHVLEHMMFKGTDKHPAGEFSRIIAANGGSENAFTGSDYTGYYQKLAKGRLAVAFELEADRMRNLTLLPEEFAKEVKVVQEERRMRTDDKPRSATTVQFKATAFVSTGYHWPIIGWMADLEGLTVADLRTWYATWYVPNNATLVVVGDVENAKVVELAKRYFGPLQARDPAPAPRNVQELPQQGERRVVVKRPAKLPYLLLGYKAPAVIEDPHAWQPYALEMLGWVLDGDDSSRLSKHLIRGREIAAGTSVGYDLYARLPDLFTVSAVPSPNHDMEELEQALRDEIAKLREDLVSVEELERAKAKVVADKVYEKDSVMVQAMIIGQLVTVGLDWGLDEAYIDRIRAVTPEQIREVARTYLTDDRLTVAVLEPQPMDPSAKPGSALPHGGNHGPGIR